jgi:leader peptidase (prepilin peptidase) / N-methyltransferase
MTDAAMSLWIIGILIFLMGACIGSFLNVCIHRIPESLSIVRPGSMCPSCQAPIRFYDNIPILSYLWLRGKCRFCSINISIRYPVVELLTGLAALAVFVVFGISLQSLVFFIFIAALILISIIDLDHQIIPDVISLPGIPVGLAASFAVAWLDPGAGFPSVGLFDASIGVLVGGGILYALAWGYYALTGKEGMGGGDIKLLAMIGAFIGWQGVFVTIFVSSIVGTVMGLTIMLVRGKNLKYALPFGPFLSLGAIIHVFAGAELIYWYLYGTTFY